MNHKYPPSISEYGKIRKPTSKSDFLSCLPKDVITFERPLVDAYVIDGPAFVHMNTPKMSSTYGEYFGTELTKKIRDLSDDVIRIELVFDVYRQISVKRETRDSQGSGYRISVRPDTPIAKGTRGSSDFLKNDKNKTELFSMLADIITENIRDSQTDIVATKGIIVVSNKNDHRDEIEPCTHEEADTRMLLHVNDIDKKGLKKIILMTVDTDVVIIALQVFYSLDVDELWIEFGVGKNRHWIPIHRCAFNLGEERCRALPFWFCFIGCDSVSQFAGRGKKTAWDVWFAYPEVTETFIKLGGLCSISLDEKKRLERFVCLLYDRASPFDCVNECRRYLFVKKGRMIDSCPPTSNVLEQHTKRACYQSSIWTNCLTKDCSSIDVQQWGWILKENELRLVWTTLPKASAACKELKKCKCKTTCSLKCACKNSGLSCTERCPCDGYCE